MSREIKFRAWVNDHWVDWIPTCKTLGAYNASIIDTEGYTFEEDNPFIVEQYTGLKDKNGKEIYEGDRIKIEGSDTVYTVEYGRGVWVARFGDEPGDNICLFHYVQKNTVLYAEVIGNVHENPELLGDEK